MLCCFFFFFVPLSLSFLYLSTPTGTLYNAGHRTWVMGDSLVFWAGKCKPRNLQGCGDLQWYGYSGGTIQGNGRQVDFLTRVREKLSRNPAPNTLVVHIGGNDIFAENSTKKELCENIESLIIQLRQLLPNCRIVWSNILPRLFWYGETHLTHHPVVSFQ